MKFIVSSSELLSSLQSINKVISSKNMLPILDNFLFNLQNNILTLTASDLETTLSVTLPITTVELEGSTAMPAKLLIDTLKEFPEQPLTIIVDTETLTAEISWATGRFHVPCSPADEYPQMPTVKEEHNVLSLESGQLLEGITKTSFAIANDALRPAMNGIFFDIKNDGLTFVASDAHKLVKYRLLNVGVEQPCSFILPKKPSDFLKGLLTKNEHIVDLKFDDRHAIFSSANFSMSCRLIEGMYPAYNSVIPTDNPNKIVVDRIEFLTAIRRVSVFSSQASKLIKLKIAGNEIDISAQDIDFSISANDKVACKYENEDLEIGFKSDFLIDILANIPSQEVSIELADAVRAGLFIPVETDEQPATDLLMLLMPIFIGI